MKIKNIVISFFLLFVYSISFAHTLTYHEHGFFAEHQHEFIDVGQSDHHHNHHSHSENLKIETAHINHNNHCDEGFFDLITCVLSDLTHHNHNDCNLEHQTNDDTKRLNSNNQFKEALNSNTKNNQIVDCSLVSIQSKYQFNNDFISPLIDNSPLRGPPVLS